MRLIDDQNNQLGVLSLDAALRIANEKGLDLVEVAPQANPPVCRLMDYGRYKFCLLYTSPSPRDGLLSRMPSSA